MIQYIDTTFVEDTFGVPIGYKGPGWYFSEDNEFEFKYCHYHGPYSSEKEAREEKRKFFEENV